MAQRRQKASPKPRSRSPRQTLERLRLAITRERERYRQALERQTAIAEILRIISSSPTDVQSVGPRCDRRPPAALGPTE